MTGEWVGRYSGSDGLRNLCVSYIIRVQMESEIGRACGTYGREDRWMQGFGGEA